MSLRCMKFQKYSSFFGHPGSMSLMLGEALRYCERIHDRVRLQSVGALLVWKRKSSWRNVHSSMDMGTGDVIVCSMASRESFLFVVIMVFPFFGLRYSISSVFAALVALYLEFKT